MKYIFVRNINDTGETGIVDVESHEIICLCDEANSQLLLDALRLYSGEKPVCNHAYKKISKYGYKCRKCGATGFTLIHGGSGCSVM